MRGLHFWILQKCLDSEEGTRVPSRPKLLQKNSLQRNCFGTINLNPGKGHSYFLSQTLVCTKPWFKSDLNAAVEFTSRLPHVLLYPGPLFSETANCP